MHRLMSQASLQRSSAHLPAIPIPPAIHPNAPAIQPQPCSDPAPTLQRSIRQRLDELLGSIVGNFSTACSSMVAIPIANIEGSCLFAYHANQTHYRPNLLFSNSFSFWTSVKLQDAAAFDIIQLSRPLISEPALLHRWTEEAKIGKQEPARCISCNRCFGAGYKEKVRCVQFEGE